MGETVHLDRKFLLAFSRGDLPLQIIAKMSLEHLAELCPRCRQELQAVQDQLTLSPPVPMVQAVLTSTLGELKRQHRQAEKDFRELLALPQEERLGRIGQARRRFKGSHLVHLLLNQAEQEFTRNPEEAKSLALFRPGEDRHGDRDDAVCAPAPLAQLPRAALHDGPL